jgi:hypothetical protein
MVARLECRVLAVPVHSALSDINYRAPRGIARSLARSSPQARYSSNDGDSSRQSREFRRNHRHHLSHAASSIFQPAGKGIAKLVPQIDDLVGSHRIGAGLQQGFECTVDQIEIDFTQLTFFNDGTPDKAAWYLIQGTAISPCATTAAAWRFSPRSVTNR